MTGAYRCADLHDVEGFLTFFADDASFDRMGQVVRGKDALRRFMLERGADRTFRHVFSPPDVKIVDEKSASGVGVFVLYEGPNDGSQGPMPLAAPILLGEIHQTYRRTDVGWFIATSAAKAIFR